MQQILYISIESESAGNNVKGKYFLRTDRIELCLGFSLSKIFLEHKEGVFA
jgi:hypothetical protein